MFLTELKDDFNFEISLSQMPNTELSICEYAWICTTQGLV